jgi:serine/threonine protein kinase
MADNLIGRTIHDQYRVDSSIPSRGTGSAYKVWNIKNDTPLVMKVLSEGYQNDLATFHQVVREANRLSKLTHPNIIPFYGVYKGDEFIFTLEKYVDGGSLDQLLAKKGGWLPIQDMLTMTKAISAALAYAHANGVVHGDLRPGNIVVTDAGEIAVGGFKISQPLALSTIQLYPDTPANIAPEMLQGERAAPTSDIYAEGILLYEMLTGARLLFTPGDGIEKNRPKLAERIRRAQFTVPLPNPRHPIAEISDGLAAVIFKAIEKNPTDRYQSANEFFLALCKAARVFANEVPDLLGASVPVTGAAAAGSAAAVSAAAAYNLPEDMEAPPRGIFSSLRLPYFPILPTTAAILSAMIVIALVGGWIFFPEFFNLNQPPKLLPGYAYVEEGNVVNQIPGGQTKQLKKGDNIPFGPGSLITIGKTMVTLILPGNYRLKIAGDPETKLELVQAWSNESTVTVLKLFEGSLFLIAGEQADENRQIYIQTVSGRATLNGSIMGNRFDSSTQTFAVDCVVGKCRLEAEDVVDLTNGQRSQVDSGGIPIPPSPMNLGVYKGYNFSFIPEQILARNTATPQAIQVTPTPRPTIQYTPTPILPTWTPIPIPTLIPNTGYGN